jgi:selenocysteine-specific elongation factor
MPASSASDRAEPRLVLGTAGHIDHGKTALCRALTGVETDRLPEERERGITIDLGFAPLDLAGGVRLGVVDVPGHEGLVRTMVAGAAGIDLVLLVVAADEGVMPQTREHVAICELLGIARAVVALTKVDAASEDLAELAAEEVAEYLAGTGLSGAPIVRVSALTGEGIPQLRRALADAAAATAPRTPREGPPRLPIDRCFAVKGFGSVVTGTLVGGPLRVGDAVEILPSGRRARIRGVQSHGVAASEAAPGARCAVNLQGIEVSELSRGEVVTRPGALIPTHTADARLVWLDVAPGIARPKAVELLVGTAQRRARVAPIGAARLAPGSRGFARLHVDGDPLPLVPGDRFVVRGFARTAMGGATLGGGVVLDVAPPRRRRSDPDLVRDLEVLEADDASEALRVRLRRAGLGGVADERLRREAGLSRPVLDASLESLAKAGHVVATAAGTWLDASACADLERRLLAALAEFHRAEPLQPGMPMGALRGRLPANVSGDAAECTLERLAARGEVRVEGDLARLPEHAPALGSEQGELAARIASRLAAAGLEPPGLRDLAAELGVAAPDALRDLLAHLEREGRIVRARGDLWFDSAAVAQLRERVVAHLREHGRIETLAYKALIGTTRRTAIPLMELFDEQRVTMRRGEARVLRAGGSSA